MRKKIRYIDNIVIEKVWYGWVWIWTLEDGKKVLVTGWALPGSNVNIRVLKLKKDYVEWQISKVNSLWKDYKWLDDVCQHYFLNDNWWCGGCKWQKLSYEDQLELKYQIVQDSFRNNKDIIDNISIQPIIWSPVIFWYRNKMEFTFWKIFPVEQWNLGFNKQWSFERVIDVHSCRLFDESLNEIYSYLKKLFIDSWFPVYDKKTHEWFFRHLVFRKWTNSWQVLINLVVAEKYLENSETKELTYKNWELLQQKILEDNYLKENITTFVITYNDWLADIVRWNNIKTIVLWWDWYIYENLNLKVQNLDLEEKNINFRVSPFSFFQTNTNWAQVLFSKAAEVLWKVDWKILDLYCWAWTIWLSFMKLWIWDSLIWIEIVEEAIEDAKYNAVINNLSEVSYFVSWKAEKLVFEDEFLKNSINDINAIIIDPPRDWLHKDVVEFLINFKKIKDFKLLYISCNPVTMSRDIKLLVDWWFVLKYLQPVDMFPHTHHIEVIWMLY